MKRVKANTSFYLADTWWFGMTNRCPLDTFALLAKDREKKGFTAVQIVIGVPPEVSFFSPNAANSGGTPFNEDYSINLKYFDEVDKKIDILLAYNLTPLIVGGWGPHIDIAGESAVKNLWNEIITRYHKKNVIWCVCGEADLPSNADAQTSLFAQQKNILKIHAPRAFSLARNIYNLFKKPSASFVQKGRLAAWNRIAIFIAKTDPSHNPITIHTHSSQRASRLFHNPNWLTIDSIQTGHSENSRKLIRTAALSAHKEDRTFINLEPWYEGILGKFPAEDQRYAFWVSILSGATGHAYGAHGVWNMGDNDDFLAHWGKSNWKKAMDFPGSTDIGKAAKFLKSLGNTSLITPLEDVVSPSWNNQDQMLPVAASSGQTLIIYVPNTNESNRIILSNKIKPHLKASIFSPNTFKMISIPIRNNTLNIPSQQTRDVVITVEFDTIEA